MKRDALRDSARQHPANRALCPRSALTARAALIPSSNTPTACVKSHHQDSRDEERPHIFFPHTLAQRTTQWERGDDPMTQFAFTDDYDEFGQPRQQTAVALPRRAARRRPVGGADETRILATHTRTVYASPDPELYLHDRVAHVRAFEMRNPSGVAEADSGNLTQVLVEQANAARAIHQAIPRGNGFVGTRPATAS